MLMLLFLEHGADVIGRLGVLAGKWRGLLGVHGDYRLANRPPPLQRVSEMEHNTISNFIPR